MEGAGLRRVAQILGERFLVEARWKPRAVGPR